MGACGCGDFNGLFKFKGPGKSWYTLEIYGGCEYCDTPIGVILTKFKTTEALAVFGIAELPDAPFEAVDDEKQVSIPILDVEDIKKRLKQGGMDAFEVDELEALQRGEISRLVHNTVNLIWKKGWKP